MDIQFYDYNDTTGELTRLCNVDNYFSFSFTRSYSGIGSFEINISANAAALDRIKISKFIKFGEGKSGLITTIEENISADKATYIISGLELKGIVEKRIIIPPNGQAYLKYTNKSPEYIIANIINSQIISVTQPQRKVYGTIAAYDETTPRISFEGRYDEVGEAIVNIAETYGIGWYADIENNAIVWHIYHGVDRTIEQSENNRLILSYDDNSLLGSDLELSSSVPNYAIVAGQGEGVERSIAAVGSSANYGLARNEVFIDARDLADDTLLPQRGNEKLAEYGDNNVYSMTFSPLMIEQYRTRFDLGDVGTIKTAAIQANCLLSEVTEVYEGGTLKIDVQFGYGTQTINSVIKQITSNANNLIKVEQQPQDLIPIYRGGTGATTAPQALINLGLSATAAEINYTDGVTSNIQAQLNGKAATGHTHTYAGIELTPASGASHGGYIDFHFGGSSADYTSRIIEAQQGVLSTNNTFRCNTIQDTSGSGIASSFTVSGTKNIQFGNTSSYMYLPCSHGRMDIKNSSGTFGFRWQNGSSGSVFASHADGKGALGNPTMRWNTVYATVGSINTSDRRKKKDISNDLEIYKSMMSKLTPVKFRYNDIEGDKIRFGFIAQEVEAVAQAEGIDVEDITFLRKEEVEDSKIPDGILYELIYSEFIPLNTAMIQDLQKRLDAIEEVVKCYI